MSLEEKDAHSSRIIGPLHPLVWVVLGLIVWAIPAGAGGAWFAALSEDDKKAVNGAACALTTGPIATAVLMVPNLLMAQRFVDFGMALLVLFGIPAPAAAAGALCGWLRRCPGAPESGTEVNIAPAPPPPAPQTSP